MQKLPFNCKYIDEVVTIVSAIFISGLFYQNAQLTERVHEMQQIEQTSIEELSKQLDEANEINERRSAKIERLEGSIQILSRSVQEQSKSFKILAEEVKGGRNENIQEHIQ